MQESTEKTDEEIAYLVQAGNKDLFGILIDRYDTKLRRYGSLLLKDVHEQEDVLQNTFIKTYIAIQSFNTSQKFSSWIYRIFHNEALNSIKKKKALPFSLFSITQDFIESFSSYTLEEEYDKEYYKMRVQKTLDTISPRHKEILLLYFFEELSYKEISDILHIPVSSVGVRLQRAKKEIKEKSKEFYGNN